MKVEEEGETDVAKGNNEDKDETRNRTKYGAGAGG